MVRAKYGSFKYNQPKLEDLSKPLQQRILMLREMKPGTWCDARETEEIKACAAAQKLVELWKNRENEFVDGASYFSLGVFAYGEKDAEKLPKHFVCEMARYIKDKNLDSIMSCHLHDDPNDSYKMKKVAQDFKNHKPKTIQTASEQSLFGNEDVGKVALQTLKSFDNHNSRITKGWGSR